MIRRIGRNDPSLTKLHIKHQRSTFDMMSTEYGTYTGNNYSKVGESISENTQIKALTINLNCNVSDMVDGLRKNTSINELTLRSNRNNTNNPDAEILQEIRQLMEVYKGKNTLTTLSFRDTTVPSYVKEIEFMRK
jgi:hypothetical protein